MGSPRLDGALGRACGGRARRRCAGRPVAAAIAVVVTVCFLLPSAFTELEPGRRAAVHPLRPPARDLRRLRRGRERAHARRRLREPVRGAAAVRAVADPVARSTTRRRRSRSSRPASRGLALLAVWRLLALAARDELAGLALYVPVLALSVVPLAVAGDERLTNASQYQLLPERYLLPLLTAWVLARHLRGLAPRGRGLPIGLRRDRRLQQSRVRRSVPGRDGDRARARRGVGRRDVAELRPLLARRRGRGGRRRGARVRDRPVRTGSLPSPATVLYYSRLFGSQGYGMIAMPVLGLHLAVFATFAGRPDRRRRARPRRRTTTAALTGPARLRRRLRAAGFVYYGGRSNAYSLIGLFPAWGLALALLTWLVVGRLRGARRPAPTAARRAGALGVCALVGFGLAVTTVIEVAAPWDAGEPDSPTSSSKPSSFDLGAVERFVGERLEARRADRDRRLERLLDRARGRGRGRLADRGPGALRRRHAGAGRDRRARRRGRAARSSSATARFPPPLPSVSAYLASAGLPPGRPRSGERDDPVAALG